MLFQQAFNNKVVIVGALCNIGKYCPRFLHFTTIKSSNVNEVIRAVLDSFLPKNFIRKKGTKRI